MSNKICFGSIDGTKLAIVDFLDASYHGKEKEMPHKVCTYPLWNHQSPICTGDCEGCSWYELSGIDEESKEIIKKRNIVIRLQSLLPRISNVNDRLVLEEAIEILNE